MAKWIKLTKGTEAWQPIQFVTVEDLEKALRTKQDTLVAGENIDIAGQKISAKDTEPVYVYTENDEKITLSKKVTPDGE